MVNVIIIVVITVLAAASSFVSSAGKVADNRRKGLKAITKKGWITISLNACVVIATLVQFALSQKKEETDKQQQVIKDSIIKANYDSALKEIKRKFDTTNNNTVISITETLAKYGYKADSANNRLARIVKDSSKTKVIESVSPILKICGDNTGITIIKQKDNVIEYKIGFCSYDAGSAFYNVKIHTVIIKKDSTGTNYRYVGMSNLLKKDETISKDHSKTTSLVVSTNYPYEGLCIYTNGSYKNRDGTKKFNINYIAFYNTKTKGTYEITGSTKDEIIKFVNDNKLNWKLSPSINAFSD